MLFDGDCPLCVKEVDFLRAQDGGKGKLDLVDISADDYSPVRLCARSAPLTHTLVKRRRKVGIVRFVFFRQDRFFFVSFRFFFLDSINGWGSHKLFTLASVYIYTF